MGLDTWLEQDIRQFLDDEVKMAEHPRPARYEDAASVVSGHDWSGEIHERVKRGDVDHAKELFNELRERYQTTPDSHQSERQQLYELLKESYVLIANLILDKHHTRQILSRMETSSGDIFDEAIKPIDLKAENTSPAAASVQDYVPFTTEGLERADVFKAFDNPKSAHDPRHPLSFEPEALMKANKELAARAKAAEAAAGVADETVRALVEALTVAIKDPNGALTAIDGMLQKQLPQDVHEAASELRSAIVDRQEMLAFTRQMTQELARVEELNERNDPLTAATAKRLEAQFVAFSKSHPHYPAAHRAHIIARLEELQTTAPPQPPQP
jgi:hypothetical protein